MPKLIVHNDVVQVLTEAQEEWLLLLPESGAMAEATDQVLWITRHRQIAFYDIPGRRLIGAIDLRGATATRLSADGTRLFVIQTFRTETGVQTDLQTIELSTARILARHGLEGVGAVMDIRETSDGYLIVSRRSNADAEDTSVLWRVDPDTGGAEKAEVKSSTGFQSFERPTPDGRYWLRRDDRLARHIVEERKQGVFGRIRTTYYSPVLQLWETWPPRFLRWLPTGWTPEDEMPRLDGGWPIKEPENKGRMWASIADASDEAPADPTTGIDWPKPELRDQLAGEAFSRVPRPDPAKRAEVEEEAIARMIREWRQFAHGDSLQRVPVWDVDGSGFWIQVEQVVRRISVDGTASAGQYMLRPGGLREVLASGSEALPGHRFAGKFNQGRATFHDVGRGPARPTELRRDGPDWSDRGGANDWDRTLQQRAEKLRATRDRIPVPLDAWSEPGVASAMRSLGQTLRATPPPRGRQQAWIVFTHGGEELSEKQFFERIVVDFPSVAPEIDQLINVACDALASHSMLLDEKHQVALLGHAARALGILDIGALPTLKRYYEVMIDSEHETWFTLQTVPFIVEHHGWRRPIIEFVWWLLLKRPTNGLDDYATVWLAGGKAHKHWGMRKVAQAMYRPSQFAKLTSRLGGPPEVEGKHPARYSYRGVDALVEHLGYRHDMKLELVTASDGWLAEFLDLMATPPAVE